MKRFSVGPTQGLPNLSLIELADLAKMALMGGRWNLKRRRKIWPSSTDPYLDCENLIDIANFHGCYISSLHCICVYQRDLCNDI